MVNKVLSSEKIVIAVLKAESIDYLSLIKDRPDCYLYNLDDSLFDEVYQDIISKLNIITRSISSHQMPQSIREQKTPFR